ncbi:hypothetical protein BsWGS_05752 [Bradybaena similaris]
MARVPQAYTYLDCKRQLMRDFPIVYSFTIDKVLEVHNGQYDKAYMTLVSSMNELQRRYPDLETFNQQKSSYSMAMPVINDRGESTTINIHTMARARPRDRSIPPPLLPNPRRNRINALSITLREGVDRTVTTPQDPPKQTKTIPPPLPPKRRVTRVREDYGIPDQEADRCMAMSLLEADYEESGQLIECACCFGKCVFDNMAQCMEGHLVCVECLNSFAKEAVFGAGTASLGCMASECPSIYSDGELKRCLLEETWKRLEERTQKENINMANMEDLVVCPYCDFAAILSPQAKVFRCYRDKCNKKTCRDCGVDWADHEGLSCAAVESKDETALRKDFEEKMTKAKVRTCASCRAEFTKDGGCNKMTCRCGTTMCYICRTPKITYDHFCKHVHDPGKGCPTCKACSLWTSTEADDERALEELTHEARAKQAELGFQNIKQIGIK